MLGLKLIHVSKKGPLAAIAGATILVTCHIVNSLDLKIGYQDSSSNNGHQGDMPYSESTPPDYLDS